MKYSIVIKFLALLLCAAALLGAVGSAAAILALTELGLYEQSFYQVYQERQESRAEILAEELATRHAAMSLGGCNAQLADWMYGNPWSGSGIFRFENIGYELVDADGEVVQSDSLPEYAKVVFEKTTQITGRYAKVLRTMTEAEKLAQEMATVPVEDGEDIYILGIPEGDVDIYDMTVGYTHGGSETYGSGTKPLGRLSLQEDGNYLLVINENIGWMQLHEGSQAQYIRLENRDGETVYHAFSDRNAVLHYAYEGDISWLILSGGTAQPEEEPLLIDNLPTDGAEVASVTVSYGDDSSESFGGVPGVGFLSYDDEGRVVFRAYDEGIMDVPEMAVTHIAFLDESGVLLFEARDAAGVGQFYLDGEGRICIRFDPQASIREAPAQTLPDGATDPREEATEPTRMTETVPQATMEATVPPTMETAAPATAAPEPTAPAATDATLPPVAEEDAAGLATEATYAAEEVTAPVTMPVEQRSAAAGIHQISYYDHDLGEDMVVEYTYEEMPPYTVTVVFAPGALSDEAEWRILEYAWLWQRELPLLLAVSLLVFAVMAVYLCCAAGRKSGTEAVRAAGLNALPLDLYLGLGAAGFAAICVAGVEGTRYLLRNSVNVGGLYALLMGYAASLLVVAFCFACAAQFKTPGGYWWRNSLCGRCLRLAGMTCIWLAKNYSGWVRPGAVRLFKGLWKLVKFFWGLLTKAVSRVLRLLRQSFRWLGGKLVRFFSMLPLTWQWLLVGIVLVLWLLIAVAGRYEGLLAVWVCAGLAAVIYGAHCFGVLLGSTKRMRKGDLDEKVDDQLLVGSFREFADELNGLADVAVVAARKQLKSERMKTELITNVSHDIKTPLTSIINYVDLLQKPHTEQERAAYLEVLDRQSQRLKKLVDDLMEMSKASTGNLAVDIQVVDAAEAINQALGEFSDKLEKAQLIPVFRQPEKGIEMMADGRLVWRVMSNLLSNAVKYALPGTRVYLDLAAVEDKVIISMKNISREELNVQADELLERFVRGDASRNAEGSGLGLNIAKSLMELQKGQLQLLVDGDLFKVTLIFPGV